MPGRHLCLDVHPPPEAEPGEDRAAPPPGSGTLIKIDGTMNSSMYQDVFSKNPLPGSYTLAADVPSNKTTIPNICPKKQGNG
ncbi:hypothetical protein AAFF_G00009500 [Aldrovandia affinis]|uniref:Uncharacterized protein n=1 Tax=Aldrovandia affinis TaxID=143900 RepID=A0AAD7T7G2_9TELE|nr:hypothetical protein AAFF_G00009500 [Aldrovandia affinis]